MELSVLEKILYQVLEQSEGDRRAFVAKLCAGDSALQEQVFRLLEAHERSSSLIATDSGRTVLRKSFVEGPGTRIGRYKLLQQIGEGGMGVVYMAEQEEPVRRRVALKIIKLGMDTKQVVARFEAERQALALMDHPNIARVLDGGSTESGRPYFVMELVQGLPITEFCDKNKLSPRQRLELFLPICHAIQSAHQKGVIHRDIKPSNVLVTLNHGEPVPKVIDFGIAKAINQRLTEKTLFTNYATMIGTPAYMSPEQAEMTGLDIDTRTDVYSLGVLLYELLAGSPPFTEQRLRSVGYGEIQRIIVEEDPQKPSERLNTLSAQEKTALTQSRGTDLVALGKVIKGELDWIIMTSLEKDRRRRYETPSELAAELKRHLNHEPVSAAAPSLRYQLWKFYQRNRSFVAAAGGVALILFAATLISLTLAVRAKRAEQSRALEAARAQEQAAIAQAVNQFLNEDLLGQADPENGSNSEIKVREVLDRAAERIEGRFTHAPTVEAAIRQTIGDAYNSLGYYDKAETHLRRALELLPERSPGPGARVQVLISLSTALSRGLKFTEAEERAGNAYQLGSRLPESDRLRIRSIENLGSVLAKKLANTTGAENDEGVKLLRKAYDLGIRNFGPDDPQTIHALRHLCSALASLSRIGEVERLASEALKRTDQRVQMTRSFKELRLTLAGIYLARREFDKARAIIDEVSEADLQRDPESAETALHRIIQAYSLHIEHKDPPEQELVIKHIYEDCRARFGPSAVITLQAMTFYGQFCLDEKRYQEAGDIIKEAYALTRPMNAALALRDEVEVLLASYETATGNSLKAEELLLNQAKKELNEDDNWLSANRTFVERIKIAGSEEVAWKTCRELLESKPERQRLWNYYALYNIAFGSRAEFERAVAEMLRRFPPGQKAHESERILRLATLDENISVERLRQLRPAFDQLKRDVDSRPVEGSSAWKNVGLALFLYRSGLFSDALERLNGERIYVGIPSLTRMGGYSFAKTIAAMCQLKLGNHTTARALFDEASSYPDDGPTKFHEIDPRALDPMALYYIVLRREAEKVILK